MKNIFVYTILLVFFYGCVLESKYALPEKQLIDKRLLGTWKDRDSEEGVLVISELSKTRYKIVIMEDDIIKEQEIKAFPVQIGNFSLLNVIIKGENGNNNSFYEYKLSNGKFLYREVSDIGIKEDFQSAKELLQYFQNNINNNNFFSEETITLVREKK